jgi:type II secretory pathway pseudopilin PulG
MLDVVAKLKQKSLPRLRQGGDTIVEVLVSITILSMILGGAYVVTNTSLNDTRDAQEHSNATQLVASQFEQLRSASVTNSGVIFGPTLNNVPFCMVSGSDTPVMTPSSSCVVDTTGAPASSGEQPQYSLSITRTATLSGSLTYDTFAVTATWDSLRSGGGKDVVQMSYRLDAL